MDTIIDSVLPMKVKELVGLIQERKGMDTESAVCYLYFSKLYDTLKNDHTKLWYLSAENLYSMLETEKSYAHVPKISNSNILLFYSFCLENYIKYKALPKEKVVCLFSTYRVYGFLNNNFEVLHSQGVNYIMDSIDSFINTRR